MEAFLMDPVLSHNRKSWDKSVDDQNRWTIPATPDEVSAARRGELKLLLTPSIPVPDDWYPQLTNMPTLCLATGGGQQAPLLAAAGATVWTLDNSPKQLAQDRLVAERENLRVRTVEGDMADLSAFADDQFGLIFHACSNCFSQVVVPVWEEAFRVLRPGGVLLSGFNNPVRYAIAEEDHDRGHLLLSRKLPWSDLTGLSESDLKSSRYDVGEPLEFAHTLEDQIGGQMRSGFHLTAMFEDRWTDEDDPISKIMDTFMATRAVKPLA